MTTRTHEIPDEPGAEPAAGDEVRIEPPPAAPPDTPLEVNPALHERTVWRVCDALGVPRWTAIAEIERTIASLRTERERTIAATKRYVAQILRDVARTGAPEALPPDACERAARIVEDLHGPDGALVRARAERLLAVVDAARPWQHGQRCCASAEAAEAAARGPCRPCLLAYALDALDREEREAAVEDFGVSVAAVLADPVARAAYVAHQREVAARDMRERAAAHLDSQAEAHDRVAETPGWSPSGQSEHRDLAAALREQAAHVRTLPLTTDREEREAAPASGDPELAAAVARLEGALVYVEPDESDACEHVGYLDCGRTVRRGPLRDVLIALARDVSEEGR